MSALFLLIVLSPILQMKGAPGRVLMSALSTLVMVGGIGVVSNSKRDLAVAIVLMIPPLLVVWVSHALELVQHRLWLDPSFWSLPVYGFLGYLIFVYIFRRGRVTTDQLHGAISLYLLIGLVYTNLYVILERVQPGSFQFPEGEVTVYGSLVAEFMYLSYVTLTTLGYGDVLPASPVARTLAMTEAITGVLFVGALVARVAGSLAPVGAEADGGDSSHGP